jgi:hypothetical protein
MAKLTDDIKSKILADWSVGISQNQLAKKYNMSPATINKLCKGVEQSNVDLVNSKVAVITALQSKTEYEVNSIESEVNTKVRRSGLVFGGLESLAKLAKETIEANKIVDKINVGEGVQNFEPRELNTTDFKNLESTLTGIGKSFGIIESSSALTVNNTNAQQNNSTENNLTIEFK